MLRYCGYDETSERGSKGEHWKKSKGNDVIRRGDPRLNPFVRSEPELYSLIINRRFISSLFKGFKGR